MPFGMRQQPDLRLAGGKPGRDTLLMVARAD